VVSHERDRVRAVLADRPDPAVLYVQRGEDVADPEGDGAGDAAREIAWCRDRRQLASEQCVDVGGARENEEIEVLAHVRVMLERFRKQKRDSVIRADPADVSDQLEGVADSPSLGRDGIHHGPGRGGTPLRQSGGDAQQRTVPAGQGEQGVPIHDLLVRTVVVQQQPQEESRQRARRYSTEYSPFRLYDSSGVMSRSTGTSGVGVIRASSRIQNQCRPSETSTSVS